jgi:DNA-binding transcriptional LysR family regulator
MTQSAVTKSLQEAEALLGVLLFDRTNRGVVATIFGEALVAHSRLVLTQLNHAAEEIGDLRDGTGGRIALGTLLAASAELLPRAVARLRRERPNVVVSISEGTNDILLPALRMGKLDLVVGRLPEFAERAELAQEILFHDVACVVTRPGHPLVGRANLRLADLTDWDWILPPPETTLRRQIDSAFHDVGVEPPPHTVESVSVVTNRGLVRDADYLSVLPWQNAQAEAEEGHLSILPVALPTTVGPLGITTRRNARLSPATGQLLEILRSVASDMTPSPFLAGIPISQPAMN